MTSIAAADTITVCASGCDYTSINEAIAAAKDGDVIQLAAETYREGEQIDTQDKSITIRGTVDKNGDPTTVLDGQGSHRVLWANYYSPTEVIEDLIITNGWLGGSSEGGGAFAQSAHFANVVFISNTAGNGAALRTGGPTSVSSCRFEDNVGSYVIYGGAVEITNSQVAGGLAPNSHGFYLYFGQCNLSNTHISGLETGIRFQGAARLAISQCVLEDNDTAMLCLGASLESSLESTAIRNSRTSGIYLWDGWLTLDDVAVKSAYGQGVLAGGANTALSIANSTICGHPNGQVNGPYTDLGGNSINEVCDCLDSDGDGICDDYDECPGAPDVDTDGDGVVDCLDGCPLDPAKIDPGRCGCGVEDTTVQGDFNCDGVFDHDDYLAMGEALGTCPADLNGDGEVSGADMGLLIILYGTTCR